MNFLEMAKALSLRCGEAVPERITTLDDASGIVGLYKGWLQDSWRDIQNDRDWGWRRRTFRLDVQVGRRSYTAADCRNDADPTSGSIEPRFQRWRLMDPLDIPRIARLDTFVPAGGASAVPPPNPDGPMDGGTPAPNYDLPSMYSPNETFCNPLRWEDFVTVYQRGSEVHGYPGFISEDPHHTLHIAPTPDVQYRIRSDYYTSPQELALDADEPEMPQEWHMLIVYHAMRHYGSVRDAREIMVEADNNIQRITAQMSQTWGPKWRTGRQMMSP